MSRAWLPFALRLIGLICLCVSMTFVAVLAGFSYVAGWYDVYEDPTESGIIAWTGAMVIMLNFGLLLTVQPWPHMVRKAGGEPK